MVKVHRPNIEKLRLIKTEEEEKGNFVIVFQKVFKLDDKNFFNTSWGVHTSFQNNIPPFQPTSLITSINEIKNHNNGCFYISACVKWMSDVKQISSNSKCRNGGLIDESGEIMVTVCRESLLCMEEDVWCVTDMNVKDYFGLKLQFSGKTSAKALPKVCDITWVDLTMYQNRENSTVLLEAVSGVTLSLIVHCPGNNCSGTLMDPFLKLTNCGECNRKVIVARCPKSITLMSKNLALHNTGKIIDSIFGTVTCELCNNKTDELEKNLFFARNKLLEKALYLLN